MPGEYALYVDEPDNPVALVYHYAVVQTFEVRCIVKRLIAGGGGNRGRIASYNAAPEIDVALTGAEKNATDQRAIVAHSPANTSQASRNPLRSYNSVSTPAAVS